MSQISIITPLHASGNKYIRDAYASLKAQTIEDWEWSIIENNGGIVPSDIAVDKRVHITKSESSSIGALKLQATLECSCSYIVELDCDDELRCDALSLILSAFHSGADFVYSDAAEWLDVGLKTVIAERPGYPYGSQYGWSWYMTPYKNTEIIAMRSPPVTAQNIRLVDWAPNHVRAWTRALYDRVGGHDISMAVGDDHDLIVRCFLAGAKFHHIPECLYYYRVHNENSVKQKNAEIRDATWGVYNRYIWKLAEKWAKDSKLPLYDLCGAHDCPEGYIPLDRRLHSEKKHLPGITCDLNKIWPLYDNSVGILRAHDAVEHLQDPILTMNEAYRVLAPGGWLMVSVPSTDGRGAFQDPSHVSFWNENSFGYYCDEKLMRYIPKFKGAFQLIKNITWFPSDWHREKNISYCEAHLIKLGLGYNPMGALHG